MLGREPHARRPRFKLSGLESPEELLDRLRESDEEIESLADRNAQLAAELDAVRRRLRGAGDLTDDELMAELPQRMTRNLAAAQDVADEMVERAKNDAMIIRLNADQVAAQMLAGAKAEADRIVRGTIAESQAQVGAARTRGNELLRTAHAERSQLLADLDTLSARATLEHQSLDAHRHRLEQAYEQVAAALADARAALAAGAEQSSPVPVERPRRADPTERAERTERTERTERAERTELGAFGGDRSPRQATGDDRASGGGGRTEDDRPAVFERSRAGPGPRPAGRPPSPERAIGGEPSYAGADAAAG